VTRLVPAFALAAALSGMPLPGVDEWVIQEFAGMGLTPEEVLWHTAQVEAESSYRVLAESPWAQGLSQFTKPTRGDWWPRVPGCEEMVDFPFDPMCNLLAQRRYMQWLFAKFISMGFPAHEARLLALRAYNGGLGWNLREIKACRATAGCDPSDQRDLAEVCRAAGRSHESCRENTRYPEVIESKTKRRGWRGKLLKVAKVGLKAGAAAGVPGASIADEAVRRRASIKVPRR